MIRREKETRKAKQQASTLKARDGKWRRRISILISEEKVVRAGSGGVERLKSKAQVSAGEGWDNGRICQYDPNWTSHGF
jgi:hypothetical protein